MINRTFDEVDLTAITVKASPRNNMGDMETLERSISKIGLLYPIIVDRNNVLISGQRRLAACRNAGLTRVPVFRIDTDYNSALALDVHSDLHLCRQPLSEDELNDLIEQKKALISSGQPRLSRWFSWFKGLFAEPTGRS